MSLHLDAGLGEIAETVLLPGDPLRARFIAETFLKDVQRYNERRAAFGYTGHFEGRRVSVQATGMGVPSISIYAHELIVDYGVKTLVRIGTCGAIRPDIELHDVLLAMSACTASAINRQTFAGMDYAPTADFDLLRAAWERARDRGIPVRVGPVLTSDLFYDRPDFWKVWAEHGVLAVEMETAALYTLAARHRARALAFLTVSDVIPTHQTMPADERERALHTMITLALETVTADPAAGT